MLRYEHCYPYVIGLVLRSTKRICNVPVHHRAREEGRSGYTLSKLLNLWMNGFTSFSVKPLRIATYIGTLFAVAGFLYLSISSSTTLPARRPPSGGRPPRRCCCCSAA